LVWVILGHFSRTKLGYNEQDLTQKPLKSWFLSKIYFKNMQEKPFLCQAENFSC